MIPTRTSLRVRTATVPGNYIAYYMMSPPPQPASLHTAFVDEALFQQYILDGHRPAILMSMNTWTNYARDSVATRLVDQTESQDPIAVLRLTDTTEVPIYIDNTLERPEGYLILFCSERGMNTVLGQGFRDTPRWVRVLTNLTTGNPAPIPHDRTIGRVGQIVGTSLTHNNAFRVAFQVDGLNIQDIHGDYLYNIAPN